jgi:Mg-chelatase subunit ChlD
VSLFGSDEIPVDVALVLDTSISMINALPVVKRAARAVVDALRPGDQAAIIDVKGTTRIPQQFTEDREPVVSASNAMSAKGTTALYDGVYISLREFERERAGSVTNSGVTRSWFSPMASTPQVASPSTM